MKKKMRKFADGGFTPAQEEWLGGADRTDPYILARMRDAIPDAVAPAKSREQVQDEQEGYESAYRAPKAVERTVVKTKVIPSKEETKAEKKPFIDVPKDGSIGMRQFRSDAVSPIERLLKGISGKSQRSTAAGLKKGGAVKASSASKRGDGIAQRGKTRGRMV